MKGPARRTKWFTVEIFEEVGGGFTATAYCAFKGILPHTTMTRAKSPRGALRKLHTAMKRAWGTKK